MRRHRTPRAAALLAVLALFAPASRLTLLGAWEKECKRVIAARDTRLREIRALSPLLKELDKELNKVKS